MTTFNWITIGVWSACVLIMVLAIYLNGRKYNAIKHDQTVLLHLIYETRYWTKILFSRYNVRPPQLPLDTPLQDMVELDLSPLDALAEDAIEQVNRGEVRSLRDFAKEHGIDLDNPLRR